VPLEPRVFDVLLHLLRHRDRVVSKGELLRTLWPGEAASDSVLPRCIAHARRAFGDDRAGQRVIQTVHGRGYRFVAEVEERAGESAPPGAARERTAERPRLFAASPRWAPAARSAKRSKAAAWSSGLLAGHREDALMLERWATRRVPRRAGSPAAATRARRAALLAGCLCSRRGGGYRRLLAISSATARRWPRVPELRARLPALVAPARRQARFRLFDAAAAPAPRLAPARFS
jgi:DNA-binding winged helix-turn-helix (wHTH) protein